MIGNRIRRLREQKGLSQGDIENSTGLLRCYISRVENNHTTPSVETLQRFAAALSVPLFELFLENGDGAAAAQAISKESLEKLAADPGERGQDARFLLQLRSLIAGMGDFDRDILLALARKLAAR